MILPTSKLFNKKYTNVDVHRAILKLFWASLIFIPQCKDENRGLSNWVNPIAINIYLMMTVTDIVMVTKTAMMMTTMTVTMSTKRMMTKTTTMTTIGMIDTGESHTTRGAKKIA